MYTIEHIDLRHQKQAADRSKGRPESLAICEDIMQRIRKEEPSYWPYGLSVDAHDDLFLIREASTQQPVGFTGLQIFPKDGKQVGYYSIGILPQWRSHGFAKAAVAQLIAKSAALVDEMRAFIMPHNTPSIGLAQALDVPVEHKC
jgi:RimJ/RimL family protein N-acetyltransferase